jgi:NAD(P)-dependent dehydrogenase (short-subunit alcohol dehydrogenase family)
VILFGRNNDRLVETSTLLENANVHLICSIDLTHFSEVEDSIRDAVSKLGKINGLINCAGISTTLPFNMSKPEKFQEFFDTNVQAALNLTRIVTKPAYFFQEGGSIIFMSSVMSIAGETGKSVYSMTKAALTGASRSLSLELAPKKIRVNCISPGVVETPMSKNAIYSQNEESLNKIKALHPLGPGQPDDVANACVYLLSDASRWVTGTNLIVDGGYLAR